MKALKENIRKYLKSQSDVQLAYVFGSALHGFFNEESDIDREKVYKHLQEKLDTPTLLRRKS